MDVLLFNLSSLIFCVGLEAVFERRVLGNQLFRWRTGLAFALGGGPLCLASILLVQDRLTLPEAGILTGTLFIIALQLVQLAKPTTVARPSNLLRAATVPLIGMYVAGEVVAVHNFFVAMEAPKWLIIVIGVATAAMPVLATALVFPRKMLFSISRWKLDLSYHLSGIALMQFISGATLAVVYVVLAFVSGMFT